MYSLWTETPTKLIYTDFVHILDCQVEYFISMCELWDFEHFLHTEFFLHYFSLFLSMASFRGQSSPHCHIYSYTVGICDIVAFSKFIKF